MGNRPRLNWEPSPGVFQLRPEEIHVWAAVMEDQKDTPAWTSLRATLSGDECEKAGRFHFEVDQIKFISARGLLRTLLGRYLDFPPAELRFAYGTHGKPVLAFPAGGARLDFNVSHSGEAALFALAWNRPVGVDVEKILPLPEADEIAQRYFSPAENAQLREISPGQKMELFFFFWTRREAILKCGGQGFGDEAVIQTAFETFPGSVSPLAPIPGYSAHLAVEGDSRSLKTWGWTS